MNSKFPILLLDFVNPELAGKIQMGLLNTGIKIVDLEQNTAPEKPEEVFLCIVSISQLNSSQLAYLSNFPIPLIVLADKVSNTTLPVRYEKSELIFPPFNTERLKSRIQFYLKCFNEQQTIKTLSAELETQHAKFLEHESKLKLLSSSSNDPVVMLNTEMKIVLWNKEATRFFGYTRYEIISENFVQWIVSPKSYSVFQKKIEEISQNHNRKNTIELSILVQNKLKVESEVKLTMSLHRSRLSRFNIILVFQDLSMQKKLERELVKNREFYYENKMLREFVHHVTHELRTPLNSIIGVAKTLAKYNAQNLNPRQHEGLEIIHKSGSQLVNLIKDLLDIARMDRNKLAVNEEVFEIDKMLSLLKSQILHLIGDKPIRFSIRKSPGVPEFLKSDQRKLIQILTNLLGNSVKFTQQGKIVLSCHQFENKLFFEVMDTGIGIRQDKLKEIFNRFTQADNSFSSIGTGLGLTISKKLIQLMNGEISLESELGKGTNIRFYVAMSEVIPLPQQENGSALNNEYRLLNFKPGQHLLVIIDDRANNWFTYSAVAEKFNCTLLLFRKGKAGMTAVKELRPDWVIVKIEIPEIHGIQIVCEFSQVWPTLPVMALSEYRKNLPGLPENIRLVSEPVNSDQLDEFIRNTSNIVAADNLINLCVYNDESWIKESFTESLSFRFVKNSIPELSLLLITRQKIKNLIIENVSGNNKALQLALNLLQDEYAEKIGTVFLHYEGSTLKLLKERVSRYKHIRLFSKQSMPEFKNLLD